MKLVANHLDVEPDQLEFRWGAGAVSLDLVATVGERWNRSFERLRTPADLGRWLHAARLATTVPDVIDDDLEFAREVRAAIFTAVTATMAGRGLPAQATERINSAAAHADLVVWLTRDRQARLAEDQSVTAMLSTVARDAIDLLATTDGGRLRECASVDCSRLYVDRSRPGNRRWCTSTGCGNRARTKAYRRRQTSRSHGSSSR